MDTWSVRAPPVRVPILATELVTELAATRRFAGGLAVQVKLESLQ